MKPLASLSAARLGYSRRAWRTKPVDLQIMPAASGGHALLGNNGHGKTLLSQALLHDNASLLHSGSLEFCDGWTPRSAGHVSFDAHQRDAIIASPLLTKAVGLVRKRMQLPIVLRLAYNLSSTEKGRKALGATDLPAIVRKHVLACAELELPAELAALAINLACDKAGAEALSDGGALDQLVDRLLQTQDAMLMKLLRNLCAHDACGRQMLRRAGELFALTRQVDTPELLVELLGCLGALPVDELADVPQLVAGYELLDFAQRHMVPGFTDDDVLLEVIMLVGGLARNQTVATQIARTRLMAALYSLITEKQEDDEFVLQILYAFYQLLKADEPRVALLGQTQLVIYLLDLLLDKNAPILKMASLCLDIVSENDEGWALQVNGAALLTPPSALFCSHF